jgi:hypothetical protein
MINRFMTDTTEIDFFCPRDTWIVWGRGLLSTIGVLFVQEFLGIKHSEGKRKDGDVMDLSVCIPIYHAWTRMPEK